MLETEKADDISSHLYMSEPYYFNPKLLKRHQVSASGLTPQVERLINKLKSQLNFYAEDKSPERHSIHGNSPSPVRHKGNMDIVMPTVPQKKTHHREAMPLLGPNIDGIPNRSPPRGTSSNSGGSNKSEGAGGP